MITFINESLFSKISEKKEGKDGAPDYYRMIVSSAMPVINRNNPEDPSPKVIEHILHLKEDNFNKENTYIRIKWIEKRRIVLLNQKPTNKIDIPVYLIAIPYNGFIIPIEKSDKYRIYKGVTVTLEDPIEYFDNTYKHIAYITLVPKFGKEGKSVLTITGYSIRKDLKFESNKDHQSFKTTWSITFTKTDEGVDYEIDTKTEECEDVEFEPQQGSHIFPIVTPDDFPKKKPARKPGVNRKPQRKPQNNQNGNRKYSKPSSGDNKRPPSSKPGGNNRKRPSGNNFNSNKPLTSSLEDMLRDCRRVQADKSKRGKSKKKHRR